MGVNETLSAPRNRDWHTRVSHADKELVPVASNREFCSRPVTHITSTH